MSATTSVRCTHGWGRFSVGFLFCFEVVLGAGKDSLFQIKNQSMKWDFLLWISSCRPSAAAQATVPKFVLLPISCGFPLVMFVLSSASCWITILLLLANFHLCVCWWIWAFISSNLHRMLNRLIALVAPFRVWKLPSWGEQEHLNSELLQQPPCVFELFFFKHEKERRYFQPGIKTVAREKELEISFPRLWKWFSLDFSALVWYLPC